MIRAVCVMLLLATSASAQIDDRHLNRYDHGGPTLGAPGVHLRPLNRPHTVLRSHAGGAPLLPQGGLGGSDLSGGRRFATTTSQLFFVEPDGMQIGWQVTGGTQAEPTYLDSQLVVPARYNFNQGFIYRLKLTNIEGFEGRTLYPSIEVAPSAPETDAYLTHNPIPVVFTDEDFNQVLVGGNFVTKVIYLPEPKYQELAIAGIETLVSTRLEPGIDPILEADRRGTILLIVRLGAIDLEMNRYGAGVPAGADPGVMMDPGMAPAPGMMNTMPLDTMPRQTPPSITPGVEPIAPPGVEPIAPPPSGADLPGSINSARVGNPSNMVRVPLPTPQPVRVPEARVGLRSVEESTTDAPTIDAGGAVRLPQVRLPEFRLPAAGTPSGN